ncbi:hypothetical protein RB597_008228 [Gaeumannomyces tritici]
MSGLEPIAALGLACNILQVIGVGLETVRVAKQVYRDGKLDPVLADKARVLDLLSSEIRTAATTTTTTATTKTTTAASGSAKPAPPQSRADKQLLELADKCMSAARDLQEEVNFLGAQSSKVQLVATLKIAAKTTWRKRRLDTLDRKLREAETLLQTGLLTKIYERTERTNNALASLGADLESFANQYRQGKVELVDLVSTQALQTRIHTTAGTKVSEEAVKSHVTQQSHLTERSLKKHIVVAFQDATRLGEDSRVAAAKKEQLLRSLKFASMNERRNQVADSHPQTFDWVLKDGSDACERYSFSDPGPRGSWNSFSDWIRSTETLYWISGKPGSGKTTLIKYLLHHPSTKGFLDLWNIDAVIISHFFWRPGTTMQQSIKGLLCSLLYQLLDEDTPSATRILHDTSTLNATSKDSDTDWSPKELQSTLQDIMACYPKPIAMFLDGLDEVLPSDGTLALLELVDALANSFGQHGRIKICLGARREPLIQRRFGALPQLRLEDLNMADLQRYAKDNIVIPLDYDVASFSTRLSRGQTFVEWLVEKLVFKAEGVFLHLCLTVKSVTKALHQGDAPDDIRLRIRNLPQELADLYLDMWNRANDDGEQLRMRASRCLQVMLSANEFDHDTFTTIVALNPGTAEEILKTTTHEHEFVESLVDLCQKQTREMEVRCAGLIECVRTCTFTYKAPGRTAPWVGFNLEPYLTSVSDGYRQVNFRFIHRTARDFLAETVEGRELVNKSGWSGIDVKLRLLKARLATFHLLNFPYRVRSVVESEGVYFLQGQPPNMLWKHLDHLSTQCHHLDHHQMLQLLPAWFYYEQLFNSGCFVGNLFIHPDNADFNTDQLHTSLVTSYEHVVFRQHEFLIQVAASSHILWPFILALVETRQIDTDTLSEILLHTMNLQLWTSDTSKECLQVNYRLQLAKLILARGANPSWKGLCWGDDMRHRGWIQISFLETPLKLLLSSLWCLSNTERISKSEMASLFLPLVDHLVTGGADLTEDMHVVYKLRRGSLNPVPLSDAVHDIRNGDPDTENDTWLVLAHPLSTILANMLLLWTSESLELEAFPGVRNLTRNHATIEPGRAVAVAKMADLRMGGDWGRVEHKNPPAIFLTRYVYPLGPDEDLEEEFVWAARAADDMMQSSPVWTSESLEVLLPSEIEKGLLRAIERRMSGDAPGSDAPQEYRRRKFMDIAGIVSDSNELGYIGY